MEVFPTVAVGIVQTRAELVQAAIKSAKDQLYPHDIEIIIIDNMDKKKSIGRCYNEIAEKSKSDWIMFLGDDDVITPTYILTLIARFKELEFQKRNVICVTTYCMLFDDKSNKQLNRIVQGMWKREYILEHKYDETLDKLVDVDLFRRTNEIEKDEIALVPFMVGYYYRQGNDNVSGNKFIGQKEIKIHGHKRTGNHYLLELLDLNFMKSRNPIAYVGGHGMDTELRNKTRYVYIRRNFEDTSKSLFNYRTKQGLDVDTYEEFLTNTYASMFNPDLKTDNEFHSLSTSDEMIINRMKVNSKISNHFEKIYMTPREYYDIHIRHWKHLEKEHENVMIVDYESLLTDFTNTMDKLADFLGYDRTEYKNINDRVGYFPKGEQWEK